MSAANTNPHGFRPSRKRDMRTYAFLRMLVRNAKVCTFLRFSMAIFHYQHKIGGRTSGKNIVFAAAYIRGEKRTCDRTEEKKDFSYRDDVVYTDVILPSDAPDWAVQLRHGKARDSQGRLIEDATGLQFSLYVNNQIEFIERRKDAQLYSHHELAIPIELSQTSAIELVRNFAQDCLA